MERRLLARTDRASARAGLDQSPAPADIASYDYGIRSEARSARKWLRIKAALDRSLAALTLIVLSPVLLAIAVAIRVDSPGPILFRQKRRGLHGRTFEVLKFRSMRSCGMPEDGSRQTSKDDVRTTRIGSLLRRTSLDELPQLFNVIRGDMSLVGPRPHPIPLDDRFELWIDGYNRRYTVKPGITGWAQVNGLRGPVESVARMRARIDHDIAYIESWSPLLDIKILAMTLRSGFIHENAY